MGLVRPAPRAYWLRGHILALWVVLLQEYFRSFAWGNPQLAHRRFCAWYVARPQRRHVMCDFFPPKWDGVPFDMRTGPYALM